MARTASLLPALTASTSVSPAAPRDSANTNEKTNATRFIVVGRPFQGRLGKQINRRVAIAELLQVVAEMMRDRQPQVADRRPRRQLDVAVALPEPPAEAGARQAVRHGPRR